jgi:hypothetical protein
LQLTINGTGLKDFKKNLHSRGKRMLRCRAHAILWVVGLTESICFLVFCLRRRKKMPKKFH